MSKDATSNDAARQLRLRAEAVRHRAKACRDPQQRLVEPTTSTSWQARRNTSARYCIKPHLIRNGDSRPKHSREFPTSPF
jgi:hypothetical protein